MCTLGTILWYNLVGRREVFYHNYKDSDYHKLEKQVVDSVHACGVTDAVTIVINAVKINNKLVLLVF